MVRSYQDLEIYQLSVNLSVKIYKIEFPKDETFGMRDQIRRAVSSIGANIAEGFGRFHFKDKLTFFYIARGSLYESSHFVELANKVGYISSELKAELFKDLNNLAVKLNNFIRVIGKNNE